MRKLNKYTVDMKHWESDDWHILVMAKDANDAIKQARIKMKEHPDYGMDSDYVEEFECRAVFKGHLKNLI